MERLFEVPKWPAPLQIVINEVQKQIQKLGNRIGFPNLEEELDYNLMISIWQKI